MRLDPFIVEYYKLGFCLIPVKSKTKIAAVSWKKYQKVRPSIAETLQLFSTSESFNVACLCGAVSNGLVVIDLDSAEAVGNFKQQFPDLYTRCPIVKTARGQHIYVRSNETVKTCKLDKVDILGEAAYGMLPPSAHPDGINYAWASYPKNEIPTVDFSIFDSFFENYRKPLSINNPPTTETEDTDIRRVQSTEAIKVIINCRDERVIRLIQECLPEKIGQRNKKILQLCQGLKSIDDYCNLKAKDLLPIIKKWHVLALPIIATQGFSETRADFYNAWSKVKYSSAPVTLAFERASKALNENNIGTLDVYADSPKILLLAITLRELQTINGKAPIYLAVRKGAELFNVDYSTLASWLRMFEVDGVIKITQKYTNNTATRYHYVGAD